MDTFGSVAGLILAEVAEVFIFHPWDVGFVCLVVLLFRPLGHDCSGSISVR